MIPHIAGGGIGWQLEIVKGRPDPLKAALSSLIALLLTLWVGAVAFFPVVAAAAFGVLPDKYLAGLVVRRCLLTLHTEGLVAGSLLLILLLAAQWTRVYGRTLLGPILCTAAMLLLTGFSQWNVMPRMERDRLAVGGDIDKAPVDDPHRLAFNRLHVASVRLEGGVLLAGVAAVVFLSISPKRQA